jgi:hypothetical protein
MALKGQPKPEIDWEIVRDALEKVWYDIRRKGFNNLAKSDIYKLVPETKKCSGERWLASIACALDDSLIQTHESNGRAVIDGLTKKGEDLFMTLDNEWFFDIVREWTSNHDVTLTSSRIVDISQRISRENREKICDVH